MGLGTEGSGRRVRCARRCFVDEIGVGTTGVGRVVDSDDMTSSAKSSKPGTEWITLVVVTGCGLCLTAGRGKDRIVRDEHGGNENVPDVHDASGGNGSGGAACGSAGPSGVARGGESLEEFPEEDVDFGIADDDEPDEEEAPDDELCVALARAQANLGGAGV